MEWIYSDKNISELYQKWAKLGWMVSEPVFKGNVDLEQLIAKTTWAARYDGRLMKWLMTWFKEFGDLVNKKRLIRFMEKGDSAVLGVVIDVAMNYGADKNFKTVLEKCKPNTFLDVFDKSMKDVTIYVAEQKKHGREEFLKWGYYCTMVEFYEDNIRSREWIFKRNNYLAIRSIFGANIRSEILIALNQNGKLAIRKLSRITGYAYSGVYREIENLLLNGLIKEKTGNGRILQLSGKMLKILNVAA